jgi:hypothetical protein
VLEAKVSGVWHRQKFWMLEGAAERSLARQFLRRRFPAAFALLSRCLEEGDPYDVVHPNNPNEYEDVVRELLVMADRVDGDLSRLSRPQVEDMVREALGRCFEAESPGEPVDEPDDEDSDDDETDFLDEGRLQLVVDLICAGAAGPGNGDE